MGRSPGSEESMMKRSNDHSFVSLDARFRVVLTAAVVERIISECVDARSNETGGILAGTYSPDKRSAVITHMSGPPRDSRRGRSWLVRGVVGLKEWLLELWSRKVAYYIGEWHFHPDNDPTPSPDDVAQLQAIALSPQYRCPEPVLVILGGDLRGKWKLSVSVFERNGHYSLSEES
jgi:integrative and conjugative element protein (TIGR02256 family)